MSKPKKPVPVTELQANLRDIAARPAHYQALSIERGIPPDSKNSSAIEALRSTALVHAAKTELEAQRHLTEAVAHWKDAMLWDDALKGEDYSVAQANRRKGKTKLNDAQKRQIVRAYEEAFSKYGTVQALAREYDVSEDTINRVVSKKETKQD